VVAGGADLRHPDCFIVSADLAAPPSPSCFTALRCHRDGAVPRGECEWGAAGGEETGGGDRLMVESHRARSVTRSKEGTTCVDPTCQVSYTEMRRQTTTTASPTQIFIVGKKRNVIKLPHRTIAVVIKLGIILLS
jgi:hypothetical protein